MSMELIDRKQLQIETQTLEDVGQSEMQFYSVEQVDNAPTVKAIPLDKVEQIRAEIELEKLGYPPSAGYYKAIMKVLEIIDKAIKEQNEWDISQM